jgi:hypothetical protein
MIPGTCSAQVLPAVLAAMYHQLPNQHSMLQKQATKAAHVAAACVHEAEGRYPAQLWLR